MLGQRTLCICARLSSSHFGKKLPKLKTNHPGLLSSHWRTISTPHENHGEDKQNQDETRIYYGSLTPRMKAVKVFSLTTSISGIIAQPVLIEQGSKMGGTALAVFFCGFVGFFTFVTPFLLHVITKKYVTEIHYDQSKEEYTATTLSLFLQKVKTKFTVDDVKVPDVPGMFTSIVAKGTPLFLDPSQFTDTEHYIKIMGYDKPIDFKLNLNDENSNTPNDTHVKK